MQSIAGCRNVDMCACVTSRMCTGNASEPKWLSKMWNCSRRIASFEMEWKRWTEELFLLLMVHLSNSITIVMLNSTFFFLVWPKKKSVITCYANYYFNKPADFFHLLIFSALNYWNMPYLRSGTYRQGNCITPSCVFFGYGRGWHGMVWKHFVL